MFFNFKQSVLFIAFFTVVGSVFADERIMRSQDSVTERRHSELEALGVMLVALSYSQK